VKIGSLMMIGNYSPIYHDGWVKGEMPYTTRGNVIGVVVGSKLEGGIMENPRTFLKVITSEKIGWINSQFCVEV
jgi:hypothetical protein